jgi:hypothetical protein
MKHLTLAERIEERELNDLRRVMATAEGRRIVWWVLELGGAFRSVFDPNPQVMSFNEGGRNVALKILHRIEQAQPDRLAQMMAEAKKLREDIEKEEQDVDPEQ